MRKLQNHKNFTVLKSIASIWLCFVVISEIVSFIECYAMKSEWTFSPDNITGVSNRRRSMSEHVSATSSQGGSLTHPVHSIGSHESASSSPINGGPVRDAKRRNINVNILSNLPLGDIIRAMPDNFGLPAAPARRSFPRHPRFPR